MEKVRVELSERSYDILIGRDILASTGEMLKPFGFSRKITVISNPAVFNIYGSTVVGSLEKAGFQCNAVLIPDGESYKDYFWSYHILSELLKNRLDRNSCLVALGGGVIGDITGFVASLYMRGIHFVQLPTTLLAQVDSSVGGKTGVNHPMGKNMIGSFYQPKLVCIDINTLRTLPARELLCGIAEIIKYGVIKDADLFRFMEEKKDDILNLEDESVKHIVKRSCEIKADVVSSDERESGLRAVLNFGHTIGHAIETETGYSRFLHGEAVAIGMHFAARLSEVLGLMNIKESERIKALLKLFGLPTDVPSELNADALVSHMRLDKKAVAGEMKFIIPEAIGRVRIQKGIAESDVKKTLSSVCK